MPPHLRLDTQHEETGGNGGGETIVLNRVELTGKAPRGSAVHHNNTLDRTIAPQQPR
jgi:hypothetical protein